jgi:hypothetical protein
MMKGTRAESRKISPSFSRIYSRQVCGMYLLFRLWSGNIPNDIPEPPGILSHLLDSRVCPPQACQACWLGSPRQVRPRSTEVFVRRNRQSCFFLRQLCREVCCSFRCNKTLLRRRLFWIWPSLRLLLCPQNHVRHRLASPVPHTCMYVCMYACVLRVLLLYIYACRRKN